jgi:hypothetical protein
MCNVPTHLQKISKPILKSYKTKQSCKSSYTILERPLGERHGEHAKVKINVL